MSKNSFKVKEALSLEASSLDKTTYFSESFESGSFSGNSWTVINGAQANKWFVGTATKESGLYSAYISNDSGVTNTYSITSSTSVVFFYKDFLIPPLCSMEFSYKQVGEAGFDRVSVVIDPALTTPVAGTSIITAPSGGSFTNFTNNSGSWAKGSVDLSAFSGSTVRIIFQWVNDSLSGLNPPAAVDNIQLLQTEYSSGSLLNENGSIKYYDGTSLNLVGTSATTDIDVVLRNKYDLSGNSYTEMIPQFPWTSPVKLADPASPPGWPGRYSSWSPNGEFLAIGVTGTPFIAIYQRSGITFTRLANPAVLPASTVYGVSWSSNGEFLATAHATTPFMTVYQRSGTTFTKLADPVTLPPFQGNACSWSHNGEFLAVAHFTSPFISFYQRSGTTLTKLANPAILPAAAGEKCNWSPNGEFLAVTHSFSPFVTIYQRSGTTFTKLANPASLPVTPGGVSWSCDGEFLALGDAAIGANLAIYQRSGTTFTKLSFPVTAGGSSLELSWSPQGKFLAVGSNSSPHLTIYQRSGTSFTKLADVSSLPPSNSRSISWSPNGEFLTLTHDTSPYLNIYQTSSDIPDNSLLRIVNPKLGQS